MAVSLGWVVEFALTNAKTARVLLSLSAVIGLYRALSSLSVFLRLYRLSSDAGFQVLEFLPAVACQSNERRRYKM